MTAHIARFNERWSMVWATVRHVFARRKGPMALVMGTNGLAQARVKIGLANLVYNMHHVAWLPTRGASELIGA